MKKLAIVFCMILVSANIFAAGKDKKNTTVKGKSVRDQIELTLTPAIGFSASIMPRTGYISGLGEIKITYSTAQFNLGFNATMIGFPYKRMFEHEWKVIKNLTTILNMDIGLSGKLSVKTENGSVSYKPKKALTFYFQALEGYTFKPVKNLYITPAIGLGFGRAEFITDSAFIGYLDSIFSVPVYASIKYFFTDLIGIEGAVLNSFGFGTAIGGFANTFILKAGTVFKF